MFSKVSSVVRNHVKGIAIALVSVVSIIFGVVSLRVSNGLFVDVSGIGAMCTGITLARLISTSLANQNKNRDSLPPARIYVIIMCTAVLLIAILIVAGSVSTAYNDPTLGTIDTMAVALFGGGIWVIKFAAKHNFDSTK